MVEQTDYGGKSTDLKDIEREVNAAFESTIRKAKQKPSLPAVAPVSVETAEPREQTAKQSLPGKAAAPDWEQGKKQLNMRGITPETMDFGSYTPPPVLRDYLRNIPAKQELESVAKSFADVHKLQSPRRESGGRGSRGGTFTPGSGTTFSGGRGGSFSGGNKYGRILSAPDFAYYSELGANIENPTYREADGYANIFGWRPGAKDINNIVTFSRDNWEKIANDEEERYPTIGRSIYRYMTQEEVDIYNYLLAKNGDTAAQEYLETLEEQLNYRFGTEVAGRVRGIDNDFLRTVGTEVYAVSAGMDTWGGGVRQAFSKEQLPTSPTQYGSAYIREDLRQDGNTAGLMAYDAIEAVSNIAPSILASYLLGPAAGAVVQGISATGNAYSEALDSGYSEEQAKNYAVLIGVSESALQYVLGGISKLGGVSSQQLLTKISGIENGLLRAAAALGIKGLSEVTEEELQLLLEPLYRSIVSGEDYDAPTVEEMVYTAVISFMMTGALESGEIASYARKQPANSVGFDFSQDDSWFGAGDASADEYAADARDKLTDISHRDIIKLQNGFARFPDGDPLNLNAQMVTPIENCFDVAMHGTPTAVAFGSENPNMSPRLLAAMILHNENYSGQSIRLLSCSTGKAIDGDYCFAEELANILGVEVLAPNMSLYISDRGELRVGKYSEGKFVKYMPNQRRRIR